MRTCEINPHIRQSMTAPVSTFPIFKMKFYLSFENAYHCNDYISEKFWRNALHSNLVPIVFGPHLDDVLAVAPPNSFIHAEQFDSPSQLVNYIDYLDKNDTGSSHITRIDRIRN